MKIKLNKSQKIVADQHNLRDHNITRRDFMGLGLIGFAGSAMLPGFIPSLAMANDETLPAFIVLDLMGGCALPGNFLVGGKNGAKDMLGNYDLLGYDPKSSTMDDRFGLPAPRATSKFYEGMVNTMSAEAQQRFKISSLCHLATADVSSNYHNALGLVAKYWQSKGLLQQTGFGIQGTSSGGKTRLSLDEPALRPERLSLITQLNLLSGLGVMKSEGIGGGAVSRMLIAQKNIYMKQFKELAGSDQAELKNAFEEQMDIYANSDQGGELDPRKIQLTQQIFNINQNSNERDINVLSAGIAHTALAGVSGPSTIALGGYDYHDGSYTRGDAKDMEAGVMLGRIVEMAHQMKKPVFVQVITDGGCRVTKAGARNWGGDSGDRNMSLMAYYNPNGVNQEQVQLGYFTSNQVVGQDGYLNRRTQRVANLTFLNYLSAMDKAGDVSKIIPTEQLPNSVIDKSICFTA